jgi:putative two-component system response regulator
MTAPFKAKPTILIVDDTPDNIMLLSRLLKERYNTKVAANGTTALQIANATPDIDLVLLDVMMPGVDGYETCRQLKANPVTADIPVIFLTAKSQIEDEATGLALGAVDYLTKPISPPILFARVATQMTLRQARLQMQEQNQGLERLVEERTAQLTRMQDATIMAMATTAALRDNETGKHIVRTQEYVNALARKLQDHPRFAGLLTDENIALLVKSVPLHDIGKVGVPERILRKPGKLDAGEYAIMQQHALHGRDTIMMVEQFLGASNGFLKFAREIVYSTQERWDGTGYPEQMAREQIPVAARLMAVADVYDALISKRVYKDAFSHSVAVDIMSTERGSRFDPDVLDAFLALADRFAEIAAQYHDDDRELATDGA